MRTLLLSASVDVLGPDGTLERAPVVFDAQIPEVAAVEPAASYVQRIYSEPTRHELHGIGSAAYRLLDAKVTARGTKAVTVPEHELGVRQPDEHALSDRRPSVIHSRILGRWGTDDLEGYDLRAAESRIIRLRASAAENLRLRGDRIYRRSPMPVWYVDLQTGVISAREPRMVPQTSFGASTFGAADFDAAVRMTEALKGTKPRARGKVEHYDPRFDEPGIVHLARGLAGGLGHWFRQAVLPMPGPMVRTWRMLLEVGRDESTLDATAAMEIVLEAADFAEKLLLWPEDQGNRHFLEAEIEAIRWRAAEIASPSYDLAPRSLAGPGA